MWKSEIEGLWPAFIWVDWVAADKHKIKNEQILKYNVNNVKLRRSLWRDSLVVIFSSMTGGDHGGESDAVWDQLPEIKIKDKPRTKRAANMNSLQKPSSDRVR